MKVMLLNYLFKYVKKISIRYVLSDIKYLVQVFCMINKWVQCKT